MGGQTILTYTYVPFSLRTGRYYRAANDSLLAEVSVWTFSLRVKCRRGGSRSYSRERTLRGTLHSHTASEMQRSILKACMMHLNAFVSLAFSFENRLANSGLTFC